MTADDKISELCDAFQELYQTRPLVEDELGSWYEKARIVEKKLVNEDGLSAVVPGFLWNYLADADIRYKDKEYSDQQNMKMRLLIQFLKRGEIISDEDIRMYSGVV